MMIFSWIIVFLCGLGLINASARDIKLLEKLGFSLPVGLGVATLLMFVFEGFG